MGAAISGVAHFEQNTLRELALHIQAPALRIPLHILWIEEADRPPEEGAEPTGRAGRLQDSGRERIVLQGSLESQPVVDTGHHRCGLAVPVLRDADEIGGKALEVDPIARTHDGIRPQQIGNAEPRHQIARVESVEGAIVAAGEELSPDYPELTNGDLRDRIQRVVGLRSRLYRARRGEVESGVGAVIPLGFSEFELMPQPYVQSQLAGNLPVVV